VRPCAGLLPAPFVAALTDVCSHSRDLLMRLGQKYDQYLDVSAIE